MRFLKCSTLRMTNAVFVNSYTLSGEPAMRELMKKCLGYQLWSGTNLEPWSEVTCDRTLCFEKMWSMKRWANSVESTSLVVRMKIPCFINLSTNKDCGKTRAFGELLNEVH